MRIECIFHFDIQTSVQSIDDIYDAVIQQQIPWSTQQQATETARNKNGTKNQFTYQKQLFFPSAHYE